MIYLIEHKNMCKCHSVPLPITTIKEKNWRLPYEISWYANTIINISGFISFDDYFHISEHWTIEFSLDYSLFYHLVFSRLTLYLNDPYEIINIKALLTHKMTVSWLNHFETHKYIYSFIHFIIQYLLNPFLEKWG
jgi:hypothetical protein